MAAVIVQKSSVSTNTSSASTSVSLTGVTAGNALIILTNVNYDPETGDVGATGFTSAGKSIFLGGTWWTKCDVLYKGNVASGTHNITVSSGAGGAENITAQMYEVSGLGASPTVELVVQSTEQAIGTGGGSISVSMSGACSVGAAVFSIMAGPYANAPISATTPSGYTRDITALSNPTCNSASVIASGTSTDGSWIGSFPSGPYGGYFGGVLVAFAPDGGGSNTIDLDSAAFSNSAKTLQPRLAGSATSATFATSSQAIQNRLSEQLAVASLAVDSEDLASATALSVDSAEFSITSNATQNSVSIGLLNPSINIDSNNLQLELNVNIGSAIVGFVGQVIEVLGSNFIELASATYTFISNQIDVRSSEVFQVLRRGRSRFRTLFDQ